jgi:hypothetical protein
MLYRPIRAPGRAGNAFACENCGKALRPKRGSRRQRFCCEACRKSVFRAYRSAARYDGAGPGRSAESAAGALKSVPRCQTPGPSRSVQNNANNSKAYNGHFRDRTPNISGPEQVITQEVIHGLDWHVLVSPDGVVCLVAQIARR